MIPVKLIRQTTPNYRRKQVKKYIYDYCSRAIFAVHVQLVNFFFFLRNFTDTVLIENQQI